MEDWSDTIGWASMVKPNYEKVKQDLEVLEILRKNIAYIDIVKDQKEILEILIKVKEEDRPKIKEWLNNDNK